LLSLAGLPCLRAIRKREDAMQTVAHPEPRITSP
jgi:hypothetical protein